MEDHRNTSIHGPVTRTFALAALAIALACGPTAEKSETAMGGAKPSIRMIRPSPGISLEIVDWGGRGPALVFLAGLGNTAHVFDDFAPMFTDSFHVLGITRRGFGASSAALPPGNPDTLVHDIQSILDSLRLKSVVLVGHSIAGEEMMRFAEIDSSRCAGLIYLDAAYDRTKLLQVVKNYPIPPPPPMRSADSASVEAVGRYWVRTEWASPAPQSEILALARFDSEGRYIGDVTPDSLEGRVLAAVRTPTWDRTNCRSLGVYAVSDSTVEVLPYYSELDSAGRVQSDAVFKAVAPMFASRNQFKKNPLNEVVEMRGAGHYVFLSQPKIVERAMRTFLAKTHLGQPTATR